MSESGPPAPEMCPTSDGTVEPISDPSTFASDIQGLWLLCSTSGIFLTPDQEAGGVVGLDLESDGRFSVLRWDSAHVNVIRMRSIEHAGAYTVKPYGQNQFEVDFSWDVLVFGGLASYLTTGPNELVILGGPQPFRYIPWSAAYPSGGPNIVDEPAPTPDLNGCAATGIVEPGVPAPSLVQGWRLCSGTGTGLIPNESGLALAPDGRYALLAGPSLQPATGPWATGRYTMPLPYQVTLIPDSTSPDGGGGGNTMAILPFALTESPALFVVFQEAQGTMSTYAPLGPVDGGL